MASTYDVGDLVRCSGVFTDANDDLIDPEKVYFKFKGSDDVVTTYEYEVNDELVRLSAGRYYVDISVNKAGPSVWYRFYSEGAGQAAGEKALRIRASRFN